MDELRHVAIIMDGNGRWAHERGLPRASGHKAGVETLCEIVHHANNVGLKWLTLFAFSSENWERPQKEVQNLLNLLDYFMGRELYALHKANIHIKIIGDRAHLSPSVCTLLNKAESLTKNNKGLCLIVAFNYGGRNEIIRAVQKIAIQVKESALTIDAINEDILAQHLDLHPIPDPDLIIRTGGELRLSNFLLWQCAYSEFYFCKNFWPDFSSKDFDAALENYHNRERRFGKIKASDPNVKG